MLKLLVLSTKRPGGHINDLVHRGFLDAFPGDVTWYGPGEIYDTRNYNVEVMLKTKKFDLVLVNMKKRVPWLSMMDIEWISERARLALLDVDVWGQHSHSFYRFPFHHIFVRAKVDAEEMRKHVKIPVTWLPFSVHPDWLCEPTRDRPIPVGFCGTTEPASLYPGRRGALEALGSQVTRAKVYGISYMRWWSKCTIGMSCGGAIRGNVSKDVIIPAAGALLMNDGPPGTEDLLPRGSYVTYKPDGINALSVAMAALADKDLSDRRMAAYEAVKDRHLHFHRWSELLAAVGIDGG